MDGSARSSSYLAWAHGDGPEVHAPAETWLRVLGGLKVGADEVTDLSARLQTSAA